MSRRYTDYQEAYNAAVELATSCNIDVAIRAVREYGKPGFNVAFASKNDSDYARAEIVTPKHPKTKGGTK
jgi:hypothetical protein